MKRSRNLLLLLPLIAALLAVAVACGGKTEAKDSAPIRTPTSSLSYEMRSETMGKVTVDVTPLKLGAGEERNEFKVAFNTHSGDLGFDFSKLMTLKDDLGNDYAAEAWTGESGGHHVGGDIVFPKLKPGAKKVMLTIAGIEGVSRSFGWELK